MDGLETFGGGAAIIVTSLVTLKVFFTLWRLVERKLFPEKLENAMEITFKTFRNRRVTIVTRSGPVFEGYRYVKSVYFDVSEFGSANPVYFEFRDASEQAVLVAGTEIVCIRCLESS